ncbi:MAG: Mrp/NBP35 family ATP-binding protein [Candidatus Neomarinimicrobiota bacterium]
MNHNQNPTKENQLPFPVIGVMSGKGGVGKSTITTLLALALNKRGKRVGIFDADLTGPSIPGMLGLKDQRVFSDGTNLHPVISDQGIAIISMNLMLDDTQAPLIWRGPLLSKALQQIWGETLWGDLDYLLIDLPPGTADVPLSVMQSFPLSGLAFVTTPHDVVITIVEKSIGMARKMNMKMLGVIENLSYFKCPHCGEKTDLFSSSSPSKVPDLPDLGRLPLVAQAILLDSGKAAIATEISAEVDNILDLLLTGLEKNTNAPAL